MRIEIQSLTEARPVIDDGASPAKRSLWKRSIPVAAAFAIGALLSGIALWQLKPRPRLPVIRLSLAIPESLFGTLFGRRLAISPDGTQIVYAANRQLYIRSLSDPEPKAIPGTEDTVGATSPVFSPDGRSIAFVGITAAALKSIRRLGELR